MKNTTPVRWNNCLVQDNFLFPRMKTAHETTIPSSVTTLGNYLFASCYNLLSVTFENPDGWFCYENLDSEEGVEISSLALENAITAKNYLRYSQYYMEYYWRRK